MSGLRRPNCEKKGCLPHGATCVLIWELPSGREIRFSCDEHAEKFRSVHPYYVARLLGYYE
jgi:hypothetical protein